MDGNALMIALNGTKTLNDTTAWTGEAVAVMVTSEAVFSVLNVDGADSKNTLISAPASSVDAGTMIRPRQEKLITSVTLTSGKVTLILK
jgi:hypothetical protein